LIALTGNPLDASATRTITVPAGEPIFFPLLNTEGDSTTFNPPGQPAPDPPVLFAQLPATAPGFIDHVTALHASIDGFEIPTSELFGHREVAPQFSITLPANNLEQFFGYTNLGAGSVLTPAATDGYWLMITSLSPGVHVINFGGTGDQD